ncbi:MAG: septum site-determining protein MinC [Kofleriaceae bacterium]
MSSSNAVVFDDAEPVPELVEEMCVDASPFDPENIARISEALSRPAAVLRGTAKGLEIVLDGRAGLDAIAAALNERLAEAPGFFRGSNVRVRVEDGPLAPGVLARLDEIATRFELRVVELGAARHEPEAVPSGELAAGSAPSPTSSPTPVPTPSAVEPAPVAAHVDAIPDDMALGSSPYETLEVDREVSPPASSNDDTSLDKLLLVRDEPVVADVVDAAPDEAPQKTRVVVGPVRSGVILDHRGHLIVFGDVNPGAEVRAEGNIIVLGRLRGTAHAGIGRDVGFILALRLEPQQLRIGRMVARASDSDAAASEPEIARIHSDSITVERYSGRLPRDLAASI